MTPEECRLTARQLGCALVIPTYNNGGTVAHVVAEAAQWCADVIVVNDGSTDNTANELAHVPDGVEVTGYADGKNRGKGHALIKGLRRAAERGFRYALTMDADGQHYAADADALLREEETHPGSFIIGARNIEADGMPQKNTFANKFSNFWFRLFTLVRLSDTQSGFRLYPLEAMRGMRFFTPRYEFEVEVAVRLAWRGVRVVNVPIRVAYPPDRVSHFRPGPDFLRISALNTVLLLVAVLWFYPVRSWRWLRSGEWRAFLSRNLLHSGESAERLACGVALGAAMSVMPIWGFQTVTAIGLAHILRLNKIVVGAFANISLPPLIPLIVYGALHLGGFLLGHEVSLSLTEATAESVGESVTDYAVGSAALGVLLGVTAWPVAWGLIRIFRK